MLEVNIFDNTCQHHLKDDGYWTSTFNRKPKNIKFLQRLMHYDGITLFTDDYILSDVVDKVKSKIKIAWCLESPAVQPMVHNHIHEVESKFDYIFTYRDDLIKNNPKKFLPNSPGGSYIADNDMSLYSDDKNKNCSLILSEKQFLPGHYLRYQIKQSCMGVDFFGRGSSNGFIKNKLTALKNYRFHIVIENIQMEHYFTEKLIDCFLTGCIPIYWGAPNIGDYFNKEGILSFNDLSDLSTMKIKRDFFEQKKDVIKENFNFAMQYISSDDYLASKIKNVNV